MSIKRPPLPPPLAPKDDTGGGGACPCLLITVIHGASIHNPHSQTRDQGVDIPILNEQVAYNVFRQSFDIGKLFLATPLVSLYFDSSSHPKSLRSVLERLLTKCQTERRSNTEDLDKANIFKDVTNYVDSLEYMKSLADIVAKRQLPPDLLQTIRSCRGVGLRFMKRGMPVEAIADSRGMINDVAEQPWLTLWAAKNDLHPHVFGCTLYRQLHDQTNHMVPVYLVENGTDFGHWLLHSGGGGGVTCPTRPDINLVGSNLETSMERAAKYRLLMTDINPSNMVLDNDLNVRFIDLDTFYAARLNGATSAQPECINFINSLLLLNVVACEYLHNCVDKERASVIRDVFAKRLQYIKGLRQHIGLCQIISNIMFKEKTTETSPEGDDATINVVCDGDVCTYKHTNGENKNKKDERGSKEYEPFLKREGVNTPIANVEEPTMAEHIMFMAQHHSGDCDVVNAGPSEQGNALQAFVQHIINVFEQT
eukprot:349626-Prymnesium_polylepis.1